MFVVDMNKYIIPTIHFNGKELNTFDVSLNQKLGFSSTLTFSVSDSNATPIKGDNVLLKYGENSSYFVVEDIRGNTFSCNSESSSIVDEPQNRGLVINF